MRRVVPLLALVALTSVLPAAGATTPTGFAFGIHGGNLRPYSVTIANSGVVHTYGAVSVGRARIATLQLVELNRIATETRFTMLPLSTNCRGTMADVAATFIRVGPRIVRVHGSCMVRYQRLLRALEASVRLKSS